MEIIKPSFVKMGVSKRIYIGFATLYPIEIVIEFQPRVEMYLVVENAATHIMDDSDVGDIVMLVTL